MCCRRHYKPISVFTLQKATHQMKRKSSLETTMTQLVESLILLLVGLLFSGVASGDEYDVIILGGGMAGVSAAQTLVKKGITNFIIIEGKDVIGGRMRAQQFGGITINTGAVWVQGTGNGKNPVLKEFIKYNMTGVPSDYDDAIYYDDFGNDITDDVDAECASLYTATDLLDEYTEVLLDNPYRGDISIQGVLRMLGFRSETPLQWACDYFEHDFEYTYETNVLTTAYIDNTNDLFGEGDIVVTDPRGYSFIPQQMLIDGVPDWESKVHFETVVKSIKYKKNKVVVKTNKGTFQAKKAIVTFSLGVLQSNSVKFKPRLPVWKEEAIQGFLYGDYMSFYLKFDDSIPWFVPDNKEWIVHASRKRGYFTLWQNFEKTVPGSHIIQGTMTDNEVRRLEISPVQEVQEEAMAVLRKLFGQNIPDPIDILVPILHNDPLFRGAYSVWPVGYTIQQYEALQAPVGPLYFAGEAYSRGHYGFTHGALLSGKRVAKRVALCLKNGNNCPDPYIPPYTATGCTYNFASNYDPSALIDDGSCQI